jgi:hypothetical protein
VELVAASAAAARQPAAPQKVAGTPAPRCTPPVSAGRLPTRHVHGLRAPSQLGVPAVRLAPVKRVALGAAAAHAHQARQHATVLLAALRR